MSEHGVHVEKDPTKMPKWRPVAQEGCPKFPAQDPLVLSHPSAPLPDESKEDRRKRVNKAKRIRRQRAK